MFKSAAIGIIAFMIGAATVEASRTNSNVACHVVSATSTSMPSISELHAAARLQNLPDLTVKEPY